MSPLDLIYELHEVAIIPEVGTRSNVLIMDTLVRSIEETTGTKPRVEDAGPACDGWMFSTCGIEINCGYGIEYVGMHDADEWLGLSSLQRVIERFARTLFSYLGHAY